MTGRAVEGVMWMRAVLGLAARELRGRWLSWAVLVLLVALAGGVVLTAVAGARRTDSAYPRFLAAYKASDALVGPADYGSGGYDDALARLPSVAAIAPLVGLQALPLEPGGRLDAAAVVATPLDSRYGRTLEIPKMLSGRLPSPDRPGEVAVDQIAAQDLHLRVGSTLEIGRRIPSRRPPAHPSAAGAGGRDHGHPWFGRSLSPCLTGFRSSWPATGSAASSAPATEALTGRT